MEKLVAGDKCVICKELKPVVVSFKRANIEWKKKYKKYLGQNALVLSLFGNDTVMLKMENREVYKFPKDSIKRLEANKDEYSTDHETRGHSKMKMTPNVQFNIDGDEFNSSTSSEEVLKQEIFDDQRCKDHGETHRKQKTPVAIEYAELHEVLEALNLQMYYGDLVREGFESLEYLKHVQFTDLIAIGLKRGHARRLLRAINEYRSNPCYNFRAYPQKRRSFRSSLASPRSTSSWQSSTLSRLSIPEYEPYVPVDTENTSMIDNLSMNNSFSFQQLSSEVESARTRRSSSSSSFFSESHSNGISNEGGYMIIPFAQRPLGFGIMSPISIGSMVSSITDGRLKLKGLCPGLPLLWINDSNVSKCNIEETANILSCVELPFTVTFGLKPNFEAVMMMKNSESNPFAVQIISSRPRKVTPTYNGSPFKLSNIEKISNYNRIKHRREIKKEIPQRSSTQNLYKVPTPRQFSHKVVRNNSTYVNRLDEIYKKSPKTFCGFAVKQLPCDGNKQLSRAKNGNLPVERYLSNSMQKKTTTILRERNGITCIGHTSRVV